MKLLLALYLTFCCLTARADVDVRRYNIVIRYIDAATGETLKEVRSKVPLTLAECDRALQPDVRGPVKAEDGVAEFVYCSAVREVSI